MEIEKFGMSHVALGLLFKKKHFTKADFISLDYWLLLNIDYC